MSSSSQYHEGNAVIQKEENGKDEHIIDFDDPEFWKRQSIYKLHSYIKDRNENIFEPLLVSIGPYHHGKERLKAMEVHKLRAFRHFTKRSGVPVEQYRMALMRDVQKFMAAYDQLDQVHRENPEKFVELMMVDGCFILEFMDILSGAPKDYADNDPIFSYYGCIIHYSCLMRDFLLVENQLPYSVLEELVSVSQLQHDDHQERTVRATLSQMMMFGRDMEPGRHMLDTYMKGLFLGSKRKATDDRTLRLSATQLQQAGIEFHQVDSFYSICFEEHTLNLPRININDYTISTFMNLKAFELRGTTSRDFNSYIQLMESLIDQPKDVKLLESKGIIVHYLRSDECVVKLLKDLARDTVVDQNCDSFKAREKMSKHYQEMMKHWRNGVKRQLIEWISNLKQTYFSNPWSIISVLAAGFLLVLTVLQTIYTIRSFYKQK